MSDGLAAFFGAVIGSGLLLFRDWIANAFNTRKNAKYLAIRVVTILDRFVDECAIASTDDGHREGTQEAVVTTKAPSPIVFPEDMDWRSIDHLLAFSLLSLDNKLNDAQQAISAAADPIFGSGDGDFFDERRLQYSLLGLEVAELARTLRDTHDLPRRTFSDWDPVRQLSETRDEITAEREKWRIMDAKSAKEVFG